MRLSGTILVKSATFPSSLFYVVLFWERILAVISLAFNTQVWLLIHRCDYVGQWSRDRLLSITLRTLL